MSYRGRIKDGQLVLAEPTSLPEGAMVEVVVVSEGAPRPVVIPTLATRYASVIGIVVGLPPDLASDHDRELHGTARPADV